jgi:DUF971 family protein
LPLPRNVSLDASRISIEWSDGHRSVYDNRGLREACPCAMCKGEPPAIGSFSQAIIPLTVAAPEGVRAVRYSVVGRYAIAFAWSDGHNSGIYPYDYLLSLCECDACQGEAAEEEEEAAPARQTSTEDARLAGDQGDEGRSRHVAYRS